MFSLTAGLSSGVLGLQGGSAGHISHFPSSAPGPGTQSFATSSYAAPPAPSGRSVNISPASPRTPSATPTKWAVAKTLVIANNSLFAGNYDDLLNSAATSGTSLAYDNRSGEVYVASYDDAVSVVSDTTNEVVALFEPIHTVEYITSIAYDYKDNEVFLLYTGSPGTVGVVDAATNSLVASVTVGLVSEYDYNALTYDSKLGEVLASNDESGNVSVISAATNKVVASIPILDSTPRALVYDSGTQEVFVISDTSPHYLYGEVGVISAASNTVVDTINDSNSAISLAYDSGKSEVFVGTGTNVSVINDSTDHIMDSIDVAISPVAMVYDAAQGEIYATSEALNNETVISDVTNAVVATVPLDLYPNGAAYDSGKGEIWVLNGPVPYARAIRDTTDAIVANVLLTFANRYLAYDSAHQEEYLVDEGSEEIAVVSDVTDQVVALIRIPGEQAQPYRAVYDSGKGEIFTADSTGGVGLSVINDTTNTVVHTIPLPGVEPTGLAYDPVRGEIFVGNSPGDNVTIVSDATNTVVGVIPNVGNDPWSLVYDRGKGEVFVANLGSGFSGTNVTVINATTNLIVAEVNIGTNPLGDMVYDSGRGEIFVPNFGSDNVSVISDATNKVVATIGTGTAAWDAAYDAAADEVFVGNFNGNYQNITVISDLTNTIVQSVSPVEVDPSGLAFDPVNGELYASDPDYGTVAILAPKSGVTEYPVTFTETGLPSSTLWSVTFNGTDSSSTTSSIGYTVPDGSYSFTVGAVAGFTAAPESGPLSVSGAPVVEPIVFKAVSTYLVTFVESGLPAGTDWSVTFAGSPLSGSSGSLSQSEPNGSYSFSVGQVTGYVSNITSGSVVVAGADKTIDIGFTAHSTPPPAGGSSPGLTGTEIDILVGILLTSLLIAVFFLIVVHPRKNPLVFVETGLPEGTEWSVTLGPKELEGSSNTTEIELHVSNGIYTFRITPVAGFTATPGTGEIEVTRGRRTVPIKFAPIGSSR